MKKITWLTTVFILSSQILYAHGKKPHFNWETIQVEKEIQIIDSEGNPKTYFPSCAFDTIASPVDGTPLDNSFQFYFKQGKRKNLLVYFNGGGACWNDATCVASLALAQIPGASPAYNPSILTANSPVDAGGVFDDERHDNPFKNWSKVFIPYCSGDIHVGSNEVTYVDFDGSVTGYPGAPIVVKHHGFDNFMAVREWLKNNYQHKFRKIKKVLVTGASAGGYGATLNYPYLQSAFPGSKTYLFADSSEAVVTQGFINDVFSYNKNWLVENTLAPIFNDDLGTYSAVGFNTEIFLRLANIYPRSRFAQYTTEFDAGQVQFLKIMDQLDQGNTDPTTWGLSDADELYFLEWNLRMKLSLDYVSEETKNYQYYIGKGSIHTILINAFATEETPNPFYEETSAQNVKFTRWLKRFVMSGRFHEQSVSYTE